MKKKASKSSKVSKANSNEIVSSHASQNEETSLFPKIFRFITEEWKLILSSLASGIIIFGIVFQGIRLYRSFQDQGKIARERAAVGEELGYWKNKLEEYPDHRDIYFKIATLEYRLGNKNEAEVNLDKALKIDPNFEEGREMEKLIGI